MSTNGYPSYSSHHSQNQSSNSNNSTNYQTQLNGVPFWGNWSMRPPPPPPPPQPPLPPPPPPPSYAQNYNRTVTSRYDRNNHTTNNSMMPYNNHLNANNYPRHHYPPRGPCRSYGYDFPFPVTTQVQQVNGILYQRRQNRNDPNWHLYMQQRYKRRLHLCNKTKKKKKTLSQNVPSRRDWSVEDAQLALTTEKEHNKKSKNALIIKFPDTELNKDIVAGLHSAIENVHFQQPYTPRFCFVTLKDSIDPEEVIEEIGKQKFGQGYLTAEFKKDKEEDVEVAVGDIDPHTLYVGNLAPEVTKDDMVKLFPNNKRIDIGFAKKMKFTRYAFVGFRTVADSVEAFKNAFNTQLYNKSLIVRFRRLHGTVGLPGEPKPQSPPKMKDAAMANNSNRTRELSGSDVDCYSNSSITDIEAYNSYTDERDMISHDRIKNEHNSEDDRDYKSKLARTRYDITGDLDSYLHYRHTPINDRIKKEIPDNDERDANVKIDISKIKMEVPPLNMGFRIKDEPFDESDDDSQCDDTDEYMDDEYLGSEYADSDMGDSTNFSEIYAAMREHHERIQPLKRT